MEEKNSNKLTFQQYNSICQLACEYKEKVLASAKATLNRKVPPMVNIGIMKDEEIQTDTLSLICSIRGFYPQAISTTWLRNGEDIKSETFTTGLLPNVDKTFSLDLYVDIVESDWNEYTCQVEHSGLTEPLHLTLDRKQPGKSGIIIGAVFAAVGVIVMVTGLIVRIRRNGSDAAETISINSISEMVPMS
nr:PREDICTED: DLA class II histocompatibility antigen, DR-1 beta chain-like [Latimeria chalumnae]|eukprot:XP_014346900.1 PREDICTED: DLA class II histocompatibility antigen, DR-1 beta chain-like [Latimeria chalumnae]